MKNKFLLLIVLTIFLFSPFNVDAMEILVKPPKGENISIEVETGDTIEVIKEKIFDNNDNYPVDKQKLYYNELEMIDGRTFGDYYSSSLGNEVKMECIVNVILNANGGLFTDKEEYIIEDIINFNYNEFEKPTKDGYNFVGFYTEKTGGKSFDEVMNSEAGIEEDTIFYARWKENSIESKPVEPDEENPKTFDGIGTSIFMGIISLIGLAGATIYLIKKNKVRSN